MPLAMRVSSYHATLKEVERNKKGSKIGGHCAPQGQPGCTQQVAHDKYSCCLSRMRWQSQGCPAKNIESKLFKDFSRTNYRSDFSFAYRLIG